MATKRLYHVLKKNDKGEEIIKEDAKDGREVEDKKEKKLVMLDAVLARTGLSTDTGNYFFWLIFCILGQPMVVRKEGEMHKRDNCRR